LSASEIATITPTITTTAFLAANVKDETDGWLVQNVRQHDL
jgi:hypothetical protein